MYDNETFETIACKIFERLASNFPVPVTISADDLFNAPDDNVASATKGTIAFLLNEKLIMPISSTATFILTKSGFESYLYPQEVESISIELPN